MLIKWFIIILMSCLGVVGATVMKEEIVMVEAFISGNRLSMLVPYVNMDDLPLGKQIYFKVKGQRLPAEVVFCGTTPIHEETTYYLVEALTYHFDSRLESYPIIVEVKKEKVYWYQYFLKQL